MLKPFLITPVFTGLQLGQFQLPAVFAFAHFQPCRCWSVLIIGSLLALLAGAYALFSEK